MKKQQKQELKLLNEMISETLTLYLKETDKNIKLMRLKHLKYGINQQSDILDEALKNGEGLMFTMENKIPQN